MRETLDDVTMQALRLPAEERAELASVLLASLDGEPEDDPAEVERLWIEEVERRLEELRSGKVKGIPAEEVFAKLRSKFE